MDGSLGGAFGGGYPGEGSRHQRLEAEGGSGGKARGRLSILSIEWMAGIIIFLYLLSSIKILAEYERGVIFRLGRVLPRPKGLGVILVFQPIDRRVRVSL